MDDEDSLLEAQRTSLLDIVEERNRALNKTSLLHRVVIISKLNHENCQEIGQYYERLFRELPNQMQVENVSGLLLLYPQHSVHVIELSQEVFLEVCRLLRRDADTGEGHTASSKLLSITHDITHRLYEQWNFRLLDIQVPDMDDYDPGESGEKLVTDMLTQLLKLGMYLQRQPKVALKNIMDSLHDKVPELLPQQIVIGYLLENEEECGCIVTPSQHLDKYERPYDVTLSSELVWPMPVRLFPYN